ncbi:hypothetical protein C7271_00860 [filamentous cyanobacterium CCP5]|nr:hypothetical protein C7271_00860 [filamentous cyanobacterium CCP5]
MEVLDPRAIATPVYQKLTTLRGNLSKDDKIVKQQKGQAVELYTYLSTWGLLRLKAEEKALKDQKGKQVVVEKFFECLQDLWGRSDKTIAGEIGLKTLTELEPEDYLGLTGLGLRVAQEFSFWATAVYWDVRGGD